MSRQPPSSDQSRGMMLGRDFYERPALNCARDFLGKVLVHEFGGKRVAGVVSDVEGYPAFVDEVHHGNSKTARSAVMWGPPGHAYVYLAYGVWSQFAAVVNLVDVPDVVFIRAVMPTEGLTVMQSQWDELRDIGKLADSPGKLCRSFGITTEQYGADLCGSQLFLEDQGLAVPSDVVRTSKRVGINPRHEGHDAQLRHYLRSTDVAKLLRE